MNIAVRVSRATTTVARIASSALTHNHSLISPLSSSSSFQSSRLFHDDEINVSHANPVALQMINYAISLARSQKSDDSYAQSLLVLEQCLSSYSNNGDSLAENNSKAMVFMAMSTLLSERGKFDEAIEKLGAVQELPHCSLGIRVAVMEALVGLHLELGQDDTSSVLADKCVQLLGNDCSGYSFDLVSARAKAVKGLVELICGNTDAAVSFFEGAQNMKCCSGNVALSYGEFLHATGSFALAKELYQKVIQGVSENKDISDSYAVAACDMSSGEVDSAATCCLGQLEGHMGNFGDAEEILTKALTMTEEHLGSQHPKVGVILTCIALMYRHKAMLERSSALLIQEGLYRRAIELLKAPPLEETLDTKANMMRRDITALARGGYGEVLCVQQNRKDEGERMKSWAESAWSNRRLSLAEALDISENSPKFPVIDARIARVV